MDVMWSAGEPITGRACRARLGYQTREGQRPSHSAVTTILAGLRKKQLLAIGYPVAAGAVIRGRRWARRVLVSAECVRLAGFGISMLAGFLSTVSAPCWTGTVRSGERAGPGAA